MSIMERFSNTAFVVTERLPLVVHEDDLVCNSTCTKTVNSSEDKGYGSVDTNTGNSRHVGTGIFLLNSVRVRNIHHFNKPKLNENCCWASSI